MFNFLSISLQTRFTVSANRLINFLKHVPFLKKILPSDIYGNYGLKSLFLVIGVIIIAFKKVFFKFLYAAIVTLLGILLYQIEAKGGLQGFFSADSPFQALDISRVAYSSLVIWLMLSFANSSNAVTIGTSDHEQDKIMVNQLRANPAMYAQSQLIFNIAVDSILYLPYLLAALLISGIPFICIFSLLIICISLRLFGEFLNLLTFRYLRTHFGRPPLSLIGILLFLAALFIPMYYGLPDLTGIFSNPLIISGAAAAGVLSSIYIKNYSKYAEILQDRIAYIENILTATKQPSGFKKNQSGNLGLNFADMKNWSKNLKTEDIHSGKHDGKSGFAYLNAIFFDRHNKFFRKKMFQRILMILSPAAIALVSSLVCLLFKGISLAEFLVSGGEKYPFELSLHSAFNTAPIFFFIIYLTSMGRIITASVFSNCDIHMLNYPYYRTAETIFASFKSRFSVALRDNLLLTALMFLSTITSLWIVYGYMDLLYAGIGLVLMLSMGVFFAFNDLFLYYVIQPYDSVGQSKSTIYNVINTVIYIIAYMNFQTQFDFITYTVVIVGATILYLGVGIRLLLTLAPKNFKLR